jgi:hypothetical protein
LERRIGFSGSKLGQDNGRDLKMGDSFRNIKQQLPENTLFNINSLIFNLENNKEEVLNKYNCFYNPALEALCIMIEEGTKYSDLSKEIVMNMMDFAQKMSIKNMVLLLDRKNKDYVKILQGMMTVGFSNDNNCKMTRVADKDYKVLKMTLKNIPEEIEEIIF